MQPNDLDFTVPELGPSKFPSPITHLQFVDDHKTVVYSSDLEEIESILNQGEKPPCFEMAGPRKNIFFDPSTVKCGIVTCGGLCPGLNDVIRAIVLSLHYHYGVRTVFGFRYGYEGLTYRYAEQSLRLTPESVSEIHKQGGTILGSSRGPQDVSEMVDTLVRMNVSILFAIGGDGTLRGAQAIAEEIAKRDLRIAVIGIPKTIDNDISYVQQSFGFQTAVAEATNAIYAAHAEAEGARNGIGLVKLMGRQSGFIAAHATLATSDVNFCLVPEVPFSLMGFLDLLEKRLKARNHAVIVVAEGAGQDLMQAPEEQDASGNIRLNDIGLFLKDHIKRYFKNKGIHVSLKYIDPSYTIRSLPANSMDSAFCLMLGHNAVHAGMAGRTKMLVGYWKSEFTHLPISVAVSRRKQINPKETLWTGVLSTTGQPGQM